MARDHALAASLPPGQAILRLYGWESPTISFGRNEPAESYGHLRGLRIDRREISFVRRPTGGRAVLHCDELTYAVVLGVRSLGRARGAYAAVNRALLRAMTSLGVAAEVAVGPREARFDSRHSSNTGHAPRLDAGPCFQHASSGEITVGGRKLVGSAQARIGHSLLQHGSILISRRARANPELEPLLAGATSLEELMGPRPSGDELVEACARAFQRELGGAWTEPLRGSASDGCVGATGGEPDGDERGAPGVRAGRERGAEEVRAAGERELATHYACEHWTWRKASVRAPGSAS